MTRQLLEVSAAGMRMTAMTQKGEEAGREERGSREGNIGMAAAVATEADEEVAGIGSSTKMSRPRPKNQPS